MLHSILGPFLARRTPALREALRRAEAAGDTQAVIAAARALVARDAKSGDGWMMLARALHKAEDHQSAIHAYRSALACGVALQEAHKQLGVLHAAIGERARAIEHLAKSIELAPQDADTVCMLGCTLNDAGRHAEAIPVFERALSLHADFPEAHYNLALARFERADFAGAQAGIRRCFELNRGRAPGIGAVAALAEEPRPQFAPREMGVNEIKLKHDCEQLEHLLRLGRLPPAYGEVLAQYRALREELRGRTDLYTLVPFDATRYPLVARTYKRPLHVPQAPSPPGPLLNPALDFRGIEARYLASVPNVATVDALLTPAALEALRGFCLESTVWNNINRGYLGAYLYDGFCCELLLRLAWEFRERLPRIVRGMPLQIIWGFKCENSQPGLGVHADAAAVNVNFWLTDESANLEPDGGGLLVYEHDAPADWGFRKYNDDAAAILAYLESVGSVPQRIPYRANRVVVFDSDLFHASDRPRFREGYVNRRVNITLLYGHRIA